MAITYLSGERIQGSSSTGSTDTLGSTGDATSNGADLDTSNEKLGTGCLNFDGSEYIVANGLLNAMNTAGSISLWFNNDAETESILMAFCATGSNTKFECATRTNRKFGAQIKIGGTAKWEVTAETLYNTYGNWNHIVITHDGITPRIYINGSEASYSWSTDTDKTSWWTGVRSGGGNGIAMGSKAPLNGASHNEWFDGKLDDIGIWDRALTSTEVGNLYNSGTGAKATTIPSGLKVYYSCDSATVTNEAVVVDEKATLVTTFADTLGSAANAPNSGAVVDNATAIYGKKSLIFTSDTVNLGNDLDAITSAFTFTCWAYFESASAGDKTIISKTYTSSWSSPLYHSFTVHQATTNVQLVVNNGSTYYSLSVALGGAGWHFITVTKTSGHVWVLQVDNNTSGTYTHSPNWGTQDWVVGNTPVIMDRPWDGKIQDMAFWSRVLTSAELTTLYGTKSGTGNATSSATGVVATDISTTGLKAYYTFNDATTGVTNGAIDYSNLPAGTRYEETDTRKIFRMKDGNWVEKGTA